MIIDIARPIEQYIEHFDRHATKLHNRSALRTYFGSIYEFKKKLYNKVEKDEAELYEKYALQYLNENRNYVKDLNGYFNKYTGRTASMRGYFSIIRSFLHYYDIDLKDRDILDIRRNMKKNLSQTRYEDFDMVLAKNLLLHANTMMRAILLTGISSGARISEICRLTLDDITPVEGMPIYRVYISEASKTGRDRNSFITDECWRQIQAFLVERDYYLAHKCRVGEEDSDIYTNTRIDHGYIFPLTPNTAEKMFANLLKKCNLYKIDPMTGKATLRFHQTRNLFRTQLILNGMKEPVIERMLHFNQKSAYNNYSKKQLAEEYNKYSSVIITNFDQELREANEKLKDLTYRLELQIKKQEFENKGLTDNIVQLIPAIIKLAVDNKKTLTIQELEDNLNKLF